MQEQAETETERLRRGREGAVVTTGAERAMSGDEETEEREPLGRSRETWSRGDEGNRGDVEGGRRGRRPRRRERGDGEKEGEQRRRGAGTRREASWAERSPGAGTRREEGLVERGRAGRLGNWSGDEEEGVRGGVEP